MTALDLTSGYATAGYWSAPDDGWLGVGGALETYNLPNCFYYPQSPVRYTNITVTDRFGTVMPSSWTKTLGPNDTPSCGRDLVSSGSTVTIQENSLSASISGPTSVDTGISCDYSVGAFGGFGGYTYLWSTDGTITDGQGTAAVDVTFGSDGSHSVEVQVTDSQGAA